MTPVSRDTAGGRAYLDLQRLARQTNRPTDELLRTYVLERFLWRLAHSQYRDRLVLKGGLLLAAYGERRPTADVDLLAREMSNDMDAVLAMVADVLAVTSDDGVDYAIEEARATTIREIDLYSGVRVTVPATLARAKLVLRVDVNVGDPVTPSTRPVEYPGLLNEPFTVIGYPFEAVLAEKIVTMLDRGALSTRERDFADVFLLSRRLTIEGAVLGEAIKATMTYRGSAPAALAQALGDIGIRRQDNWQTYIGSAGLADAVPDQFGDLTQAIVAFAQPVLDGDADGLVWDPAIRRWHPPDA